MPEISEVSSSTRHAAVRITRLTKRFGSVTALNGIDFNVAQGDFCALLGPSGCGKTTLLRIVAGLERPDSGTLDIYGQAMVGIPPQARPVNTVFQSYALFPHLSAYENVAFGLRIKHVATTEVKKRVRAAMEMVQMADLADRFPHQLSGGQKQRVALARALINEPKVLLLDEPLAAIDAKLRRELQQALRALQRKLGTTFVYVTHDQAEALALSNRIVLMNKGRIEQTGTPEEIYVRPRTRFAASFLGGCNILAGEVDTVGQTSALITTAVGLISVKGNFSTQQKTVHLAIRPERVQVENESSASGANHFRARILDIAFTGAEREILLEIGSSRIRAVAPRESVPWSPVDRVTVYIAPDAIIVLED